MTQEKESRMNARQRFLGTTHQQAYYYLREQILSGAYVGGERVNPATVADELGVSRMPVREALRQLDAEGLVTIRPNRGAIVTVLTPEDVREVFEIRAALEALAIGLAMPLLRGEVLDDLEHRRRRMDRVRGDAKEWIRRHDEFHDFLCRHAGRPRLRSEIARLRAAVQPYLQMYIAQHRSPEMTGYEHDTLMQVIRDGDANAAERMMREHIMSAAWGVIEFLEAPGIEADRRAKAEQASVA